MSASIMLSGPSLSPERAAEVFLEIAPLVIGRPLELKEDRSAGSSGAGSDGWFRRWQDGDVEVLAGVGASEGNPRDGSSYSISLKIMGSYQGKPWWRATLFSGGYEPIITAPIRIDVLALSPETFDLVRAKLTSLLPEHRDTTFDDPHAIKHLLRDFEAHGHVAWVREYLSRSFQPGSAATTLEACERKTALLGADPETARAWIDLQPASSRAWQALAEAGGDGTTSAEEARFLAALTHPFSASAVEAAGAVAPIPGAALAAAMAHVFHDPRWRWIDERDRDAFEATRAARDPAPSRRVTRPRTVHVVPDTIAVEIARVVNLACGRWIAGGAPITGKPLAAPGTLSYKCGIGTWHSLRRAVIEVTTPVARSRVMAVCHTNCEDRLSSFGLVWLDVHRQLVWRTSLTGEPPGTTLAPVELDVIDGGDGVWGDEVERALAKLRT